MFISIPQSDSSAGKQADDTWVNHGKFFKTGESLKAPGFNDGLKLPHDVIDRIMLQIQKKIVPGIYAYLT